MKIISVKFKSCSVVPQFILWKFNLVVSVIKIRWNTVNLLQIQLIITEFKICLSIIMSLKVSSKIKIQNIRKASKLWITKNKKN